MTTTEQRYGPACEIWLSQANMQITCMVVREDETTDSLDVESLSMRGAQREITGYLISGGYKPAGRWQDSRDLDNGRPENWIDGATEVMRQFKAAQS